MGVCAVCANLKSMIKAARTKDVQKENYKRLLKERRDIRVQE